MNPEYKKLWRARDLFNKFVISDFNIFYNYGLEYSYLLVFWQRMRGWRPPTQAHRPDTYLKTYLHDTFTIHTYDDHRRHDLYLNLYIPFLTRKWPIMGHCDLLTAWNISKWFSNDFKCDVEKFRAEIWKFSRQKSQLPVSRSWPEVGNDLMQ